MFGQVNKFKKKKSVCIENKYMLLVCSCSCKMQPPFLIPSMLLLFPPAFIGNIHPNSELLCARYQGPHDVTSLSGLHYIYAEASTSHSNSTISSFTTQPSCKCSAVNLFGICCAKLKLSVLFD